MKYVEVLIARCGWEGEYVFLRMLLCRLWLTKGHWIGHARGDTCPATPHLFLMLIKSHFNMSQGTVSLGYLLMCLYLECLVHEQCMDILASIGKLK